MRHLKGFVAVFYGGNPAGNLLMHRSGFSCRSFGVMVPFDIAPCRVSQDFESSLTASLSCQHDEFSPNFLSNHKLIITRKKSLLAFVLRLACAVSNVFLGILYAIRKAAHSSPGTPTHLVVNIDEVQL